MLARADSRAGVDKAAPLFKAATVADPSHTEALTRAGEAYRLLGAASTPSRAATWATSQKSI